MQVYELVGFKTGVDRSGVNFIQAQDAFQTMQDGFIYRQVLQSRRGIGYFAPRLSGATRIMGIFEYTLTDSTKELLAFDKNFLYKYNTGTGVFNSIPFGGSMAAYGGFNISSDEFYISGTSYTDITNGSRFVFCGRGIAANAAGSSIFFYDGTNVLDWTAVADNSAYVEPPQGPLTTAYYVVWFNDRINFLVPTVNAIQYQQGILYSGIRLGGKGDKFNVSGSALKELDTYENISGVNILGQVLQINADRSNWVAEKTTDPFNPYFFRKIPSVLGTDAHFSAVRWFDKVESLGKTGVISTDGRQSLRADNKIPYFTANEISQINFDFTYGGFDRVNNQFLWSYIKDEGESSTQDAVLVHNYEEDTWSVYDVRLTVFGQTDLGLNLNWNQIDETAGDPSWARWDTTEDLWNKIGLGESVQKTLAGDNLGFIYEINKDNDDYFTAITGVSNATEAVITIDAANFAVNDLVAISKVSGVSGINNYDSASPEDFQDFVPYVVSARTDTSVTINFDSTNKGTYSANTGFISKVISFQAETVPFNPFRDQGKRVFVSHVEVLVNSDAGNLRMDVFTDQESAPFIQDVLLTPTDLQKPYEWITLTVDEEADFMTFRIRHQSPASQVKIQSLRIHASPGGITYG